MAQTINFIGKQDGESEQSLKCEHSRMFAGARWVERAYLARVDYGDSVQINVALCIIAESRYHQDIASRSGEVFRALFNTDEHLDTLFLSPAQEEQLLAVCQPFYSAN